MTETASTDVVARFYAWCLNELGRILTPRRPSANAWGTLLRHTPEGLEVYVRSGGSGKLIGTLTPDAALDETAALKKLVAKRARSGTKRVLLRLSPSDVVERTIQIPEAASDVIGPVLHNQMERIVPWSQDDTRYGYRIVGPNAASAEQLDIRVVATTRTILDSALRRARRLGLAPFAVDFAADADGDAAVELVSLEPDPVKATARALNVILVVLLTASVAISAFGLYLMWERQSASNDLEAKIASAKARVAEVKRLNEENSQLREQRERLVKRKMDEPAVIVLIEALSRALPDSAYLSELEINGRETRIVGKSDDPTTLITKLEDTPQFEDVHFSAATTREEGETVGTFSIISRAQGGPHLEKKP